LVNKVFVFIFYSNFCLQIYQVSKVIIFDFIASLTTEKSLLEKYFYLTGQIFVNYVSYSPIVSIVFIIFDKAGVLAWNFGGIFIIVSCLLCTRHLQHFGNHLRTTLQINLVTMNGRPDLWLESDPTKKIEWEKVRQSFITICATLQKVADYVAPLVLFCYVQNIYEIVVDVRFISNNLF